MLVLETTWCSPNRSLLFLLVVHPIFVRYFATCISQGNKSDDFMGLFLFLPKLHTWIEGANAQSWICTNYDFLCKRFFIRIPENTEFWLDLKTGFEHLKGFTIFPQVLKLAGIKFEKPLALLYMDNIIFIRAYADIVC